MLLWVFIEKLKMTYTMKPFSKIYYIDALSANHMKAYDKKYILLDISCLFDYEISLFKA